MAVVSIAGCCFGSSYLMSSSYHVVIRNEAAHRAHVEVLTVWRGDVEWCDAYLEAGGFHECFFRSSGEHVRYEVSAWLPDGGSPHLRRTDYAAMDDKDISVVLAPDGCLLFGLDDKKRPGSAQQRP